MIGSDVIRGYNDTIILYLLCQGDSYGYAISKEIRTQTAGAYVIKETTLYSAFNRLEKNGYIESYPGGETQGKRRTYYHITDAGRHYYQEKCDEWSITKDVVEKFIMYSSCEV
ncbi:MAG: PadR family transcriptional regulator [Eubacterium aggregans]|uniref:PadR family transcriptional regulator n=1 Tax=Eubacterium aggregans TaxID=81409 RepID=UPI002B201023|nr:PadR family transcriptional regulator [Eubacterium aggregans]MEA5073362.1 PadR family transcriptional regulator [Eubacterium aggregans]